MLLSIIELYIILESNQQKQDKTFINHELIHIYQQMELFVIPFILLYYIEFFLRFIQYKDAQTAYRNISFEKEAYANETNYNYLKTRKWFSFVKYW